jgi:hypothetical protein
MSSGQEFFRVIDSKETIELHNPDEEQSIDGGLLMQWGEGKEGDKERILRYATAIMPGYTGIRNIDPPEAAWKLFNYKNEGDEGQEEISRHIDISSPTLLLPMQAGVCPYDCDGCPFAFSFEENKGKKTKQISAEETRILITQSSKQARSKNLNVDDIGIAFVGSGDATPNQHLKDIIQMIAKDFPRIRRVRLSTVAGIVRGSHLTPMQATEQLISSPEYKGRPLISIQVSVHNVGEESITRGQKRAAHVFKQRLTKEFTPEELQAGKKHITLEEAEELLLPLEDIAKQFDQIIEAQEKKSLQIRKPSLTFVCTNNTEIYLRGLLESGFTPENTVIQLRPLLSDDPSKNMNKESFLNLYYWLRENKYDVVIMPVSPSGVELKTG